MEILKISGIILITVLLVSTIPTFNKQISALITISCSIVVLILVVNAISPAIETVKQVAGQIEIEGLDTVFKAMGIGLITQFVADIASDSGNKALANQMIFVGKVSILILALPIFVQVLEIIGKLIT